MLEQTGASVGVGVLGDLVGVNAAPAAAPNVSAPVDVNVGAGGGLVGVHTVSMPYDRYLCLLARLL